MADAIYDAYRAWMTSSGAITQDQLHQTLTQLVLTREQSAANDIDQNRIDTVIAYVNLLEAKRIDIAQAPQDQKAPLRQELRAMIVELRRKIVRFSLKAADADPPDSNDLEDVRQALAFQSNMEKARTRGAAYAQIAQYRAEILVAIARL